MKKTLILTSLALLVASVAFAEKGSGRGEGKMRARAGDCPMAGTEQPRWGQNDPAEAGRYAGGPLDAETMQKMRGLHKAMRSLGEAARLETDEAKKAELVAQLRDKIGEAVDLAQASKEKRLAQAEERLAALKAQIESCKGDRDQLIEAQLQRILNNERPDTREPFKKFPHAKGAGSESGHKHRGPKAAPETASEASPETTE
ncbi:MAG TPA: hypothetical protein PK572_05425 [Kiritimatiellia bacterium]|nr:hypothetical protein [Kiritimatiellia bacterium]